MKSLTQDAADNIDHMIELLHKQIDTYRKLQKGLLLADLLGMRPGDIKESVYSHVNHGNSSQWQPWVGSELLIRVGDGQYRKFPLKDIDRRLWPEDIRQAYARWQKSKERRTQ